MPFTVKSSRADPTLALVVTDAETGAPVQMTVLGGVAAVGPEASAGIRVSVVGRQPTAERAGFYPPGAAALPLDGEIQVHGEVSLTQVVVNARIDNVDVAYGVGDVAVQLVAADDGSGRWPYLSFSCFGTQPLAVRYRVTILRPT